MNLHVPSESISRTLFRSAVEQAVQMIPLAGGVLTSLFEVTHPSTFERDLGLWRTDITSSVNDHEARLTALEQRQSPTLALSPLALELAMWLVRTDDEALPNRRPLEEIAAAFPAAHRGLIEEAIGELEERALIDASRLIGPGGYTVRATWPLYWLFSPMLFDTTPVQDALVLARMGLDEEDASLSAFQLERSLGWSPRRINSAMMMIQALLPGVSISKAANPAYLITGIYIDAAARMKLRRFIESAKQAGVDPPAAA